MPVRSLVQMAISCAQRNIHFIDNLSDMPYQMAHPILKKVTSPNQLLEIQTNSPHLAKDTGELWQAFIMRDLPNLTQENMIYPKNPESWYKVYRKLMRTEKEREAVQEEQLRISLLGDKVKREEKKTMFVDKVLHHAREEPVIFVDGQRNRGNRTAGPPSLAKAKTGTDALAAIRNRSALNSRQISLGRPFQSNGYAQTSNRATRQIPQAPQSMLREAGQHGRMEIAPRELLPHQKTMLQEQRKANATVKVHAPGLVRSAKFAAAHQKQNEAVIRKAREINEDKLRKLTQTANRAAREKKPEPKFDFEPTVPATSPEPPKVSTPVQPNSPAAAPPAPSPPKQASPNPVLLKKRPAPGGSVFMKPTKKAKR